MIALGYVEHEAAITMESVVTDDELAGYVMVNTSAASPLPIVSPQWPSRSHRHPAKMKVGQILSVRSCPKHVVRASKRA